MEGHRWEGQNSLRVVVHNKKRNLLLVRTFVELHLVAGRSQKRARRPHAISGRPMLMHTYHAVPMPRCSVALRGRFQNGMVVAWQGNRMACVNQTRPHCVNQMGKTIWTLIGTEWERHGMCELALNRAHFLYILLVVLRDLHVTYGDKSFGEFILVTFREQILHITYNQTPYSATLT
jgi:hypothetical protein